MYPFHDWWRPGGPRPPPLRVWCPQQEAPSTNLLLTGTSSTGSPARWPLNSRHVMLCKLRTRLFQRISPINEAYVRRRDKIKNRISSQRVSLVARAPPAQTQDRRKQQPAKIVPTNTTQPEKTVPTHTIQTEKIVPTHTTQPTTLHLTRHQQQRVQIPIKSVPLLPPPSNSFKIEQWTEKLLEEARSSYNHLKLI